MGPPSIQLLHKDLNVNFPGANLFYTFVLERETLLQGNCSNLQISCWKPFAWTRLESETLPMTSKCKYASVI